jgi:hypothetical protein
LLRANAVRGKRVAREDREEERGGEEQQSLHGEATLSGGEGATDDGRPGFSTGCAAAARPLQSC